MPRTPISALAGGTLLTLTTAPQAVLPLVAPQSQVQVTVVEHGLTTQLTVYAEESGTDVLTQPVLTSVDGVIPGVLDIATISTTGADLQVALPGGTDTVTLVAPGLLPGSLTKQAILATGLSASDLGADVAGAAASAQSAAEAASDALGAAASAQSAAEAYAIPLTAKGVVNGVATLDGDGHVPLGQLPAGIGLDPSAAKYGADPTGVADSTGAFVAAYADAVAAGHYMLRPAPGTYTVTGTLHGGSITTPFRLVAEPGTVTVQRGVPGSPSTAVNSCIIDIEGTKSTTVALSADAAAGATSLSVASLPAGAVAGSTLEIASTATMAGNAIVAEYVEIASITGTGPYTINLQGVLEESYAVASSGTIATVTWAGAGSYLKGVIFRQTQQLRDSPTYPLVRFQQARHVQIDAVTCRDSDVPGLDLRAVSDVTVNDYYCENLTDQIPTYVGYGINLNDNSRSVVINRPRGTQVRHVFTTNADAGNGCPRHWKVLNGQGWETHAGAWNTHRESKFGLFAFCESYNDFNAGIYVRSPYTRVVEPLIVNCGNNSSGISFSSDNGTFNATHGKVLGGRVILGATSYYGYFTDCPDNEVDGLEIVGSGTTVNTNKPNLYTNGTQVNRLIVRNLKSSNLGSSNSHMTIVGSGNEVHGGYFDSTSGGVASVVNVSSQGAITIYGQPTLVGTTSGQYEKLGWGIVRGCDGFAAKSGAYTAKDNDHTIAVDASGAARTITLPAPSAATVGREYVIIKSDSSANAVSVASGGGTLFGTASTTTQGGFIRVRSDGTNWYCG